MFAKLEPDALVALLLAIAGVTSAVAAIIKARADKASGLGSVTAAANASALLALKDALARADEEREALAVELATERQERRAEVGKLRAEVRALKAQIARTKGTKR